MVYNPMGVQVLGGRNDLIVLPLFILDPHRFVYPQVQIRDWVLYGLYPLGVYSN